MVDNINANITNKSICNAVGCFEKSVIEIDLNVGEYRKITISVCKNCISKFR
ncbi:MAG: hypothetical protein ACPKPY_07160 [Nitrososphaeraceae archaeon]